MKDTDMENLTAQIDALKLKLKEANSLDERIEIMDKIYQLVPSKPEFDQEDCEGCGA